MIQVIATGQKLTITQPPRGENYCLEAAVPRHTGGTLAANSRQYPFDCLQCAYKKKGLQA
ncbi:MAG: hypothetical protein U1F76_28385 [Candidatus Competibacteraceae bacterium]